MRKIVTLLLLAAALGACTSIDCPVQNLVYTNYDLMKPGGSDLDSLSTDTLWIKTTRSDGTDTLLISELYGSVAGFSLPISYTQPEDVFYALVCDTAGNALLDTIRIKKDNIARFESVDCQAAYFHKITAVSITHNAFDSLTIHHSDVDYDIKQTHFYLYLKTQR